MLNSDLGTFSPTEELGRQSGSVSDQPCDLEQVTSSSPGFSFLICEMGDC